MQDFQSAAQIRRTARMTGLLHDRLLYTDGLWASRPPGTFEALHFAHPPRGRPPMNKMLSLLQGGLVLGLALTTNVDAAESGFYVGGGLGQSGYSGDIARQIERRYEGFELSTLNSARIADDSDSASKLFVGYRFGSWLGLELAWHYLGEARTEYRLSPITPISPPPPGITISGRYEATGPALTVFGEWEFSDRVSAMLRAGAIHTSLDYDEVSIAGEAYTFRAPDDSELRPTVGVGLNWRMTPQWDLRLDYDRFIGIGKRFDFDDDTNGRFDHLDALSLNLAYRFGH